jgi:D-cysteine desulfhydrase
MDLARFPRRRYTPGWTPLERLDRLTRHLGGPEIYIKRDDLLGLAGGGSKTRKLEFLVADAMARGADTLVTCGAPQSNHCRLTLAAAAREGLRCRLIIEERIPGSYRPDAGGNNFLYRLLGAEEIVVVPGDGNLEAELNRHIDRLAAEGRRGYAIPTGGSSALGSLGYVAAARELLAQCADLGLTMDAIVCATGSSGTQAGLIVGMLASSADVRIVGIDIVRDRESQTRLVHAHAREVAELVGLSAGVPREAVVAFDEWLGPGYAKPTPEMVAAVQLVARLEGIVLDPVYTGKAMAGLIGLTQRGYFRPGDRVVFLHTGGVPAVDEYRDTLLGQPEASGAAAR